MKKWLLVMACVLGVMQGAPQAAQQKFGERLVKSISLDAETLRKIDDFKPSAPDRNESTLINAFLADSVDWSGDSIPVTTLDNPYAVVLRLIGRARSDGPAASLWMAGWEMQETSNGVSPIHKSPVSGLSETNGRAGQVFELVSSAGPVTFRESRFARPIVSFVRSDNMIVDGVTVEVWSGMAPTSATDIFMSTRLLWVGVVMLVLWWFWFRRG
ncbi:hypothetical protein [Viridibacterium curvum]|uniref:SURF1-like protein n=1 Tax=Viridibacterium curvum TaxID=1101404 RepID=A0ABP9QNC7_9RHOO